MGRIFGFSDIGQGLFDCERRGICETTIRDSAGQPRDLQDIDGLGACKSNVHNEPKEVKVKRSMQFFTLEKQMNKERERVVVEKCSGLDSCDAAMHGS